MVFKHQSVHIRLFYGSIQLLSLLKQKIVLRFCLWNRQLVPDTIYMSHIMVMVSFLHNTEAVDAEAFINLLKCLSELLI